MPAIVPIEEYLKTLYRPDVDYVDGELQDRLWGEYSHARTQGSLIVYLGSRESTWGTEVVPSQRIRVSGTRIRVADVCVTLGNPNEQILSRPPLVCIEVISPEDRFRRLLERTRDYLEMGVPYIWLIDPDSRSSFTVTKSEGLREVMDGVLRTAEPPIEVPLAEIFAAL